MSTTPEQMDPARQLRIQHALARWDRTVPPRFRGSWHTEVAPAVREWVRELIVTALDAPTGSIETGPSLLLVGGTGPGKTHAAWWAVAQLAAAGVLAAWEVTTAVDLYHALRPQPGVNTEDEFRRYANTPLLVLDDYGAHNPTAWTREVDYRLINRRYEAMRPILLTSNLPARQTPDLPDGAPYLAGPGGVMDDRIASRLHEMGRTASLGVFDRRRGQQP